ncbi:MAG: class II aldolase/adducin family protein [Pyrinomonadaceae bacterium]|nr:class II aldolase/adducin family protein [Phycisphaerales bacterium]
MTPEVLNDLIRMTNRLGAPGNDYVILGEGNTSARAEGGAFWITSSGSELRTASNDTFVRVDLARALAMVDDRSLTDERTREALIASKVDGAPEPRPSVETPVHAVLLEAPGVNFIGHTHPTWINILTCSTRFGAALTGRLFPDEIVLCGLAPMLVPYIDPGVPLARIIREHLARYRASFNTVPKVVLMQNHGLIALGATAQEVENITAMAVKAARVMVGTFALGGPSFMSESDAQRIQHRLDEHYRQRVIEARAGRS